MTLNTELGWFEGDDIRVLIAAGLPVGLYQVQRIQQDMNMLAQRLPSAVAPVITLLDEYDAAQAKLKGLNESSEGRILTKADVLEWAATAPGTSYSPEYELRRIKTLLYQYFASSDLFYRPIDSVGIAPLVRS